MIPSSRAVSLHVSPSYQTAMEDLDKLLHDTGSSVEHILNRYTASSGKSSGPEVLDVRTSLSMGITPTIGKNGQEAHSNILYKDESSLSSVRPTQTHTSARESARASNHKNASSDENALRVFLEEIKKTVCNWLSTQRALLQDRPSTNAAREEVPVSSGLCLPNGDPSLLGSKSRQSPIMSVSSVEGTKPRENGVEMHQNHNEEGLRPGVVHQKQSDEGKRVGLVQHDNQKDEEKRGGLVLQHAKDAGHVITETVLETSDPSEKVVDSQLECKQQSTTAHSQDMSRRENAVSVSPEKSNTQVHRSPTEGSVAATAANMDCSPLLKENEPATEDSLMLTNTEEIEVKLPLTKWTPPKSAVKTSDKSLSISRAVEVILSPDWLPEGWVTEVKTRGSGNSAGSKDKYYVDPVSHRRFRSRKEVIAYLERGKPKSSDSPETSPVKKFLVPEVLPSLPSKSTKKAKHKESAAPSSSAFPSSITPSIASPGLLGNMFMPPFRTGQPSEWLVYESLASLPFPMFDPFYYSDLGANKSNSGKSSHVPTRPWFFSGPEASWSPFMDRSSLGKSGDKVRDYQSYYSMPSYPSEAVSKSSDGVKKSSKRKSTES